MGFLYSYISMIYGLPSLANDPGGQQLIFCLEGTVFKCRLFRESSLQPNLVR